MDSKRAKKILRQKMKLMQGQLDVDFYSKKDRLLTGTLGRHSKVKAANTIASYWSMLGEAGTHAFNEKMYVSKTILLPVIEGNELSLRKFQGKSELVTETRYRIQQPVGDNFEDYDSVDLIIVPGLAFTKDGKRCGHGKGYYDKLLPKFKNAYKIGIAYGFQIIDHVPMEEHDVMVDEVVFV